MGRKSEIRNGKLGISIKDVARGDGPDGGDFFPPPPRSRRKSSGRFERRNRAGTAAGRGGRPGGVPVATGAGRTAAEAIAVAFASMTRRFHMKISLAETPAQASQPHTS
jgi:hypothetical protein